MAVMSLEELSAKQEITELLYRYCRGIDRLDWDLVRSCYHNDAFDDHGLVRGGVDEFVAFFTEMLTPMIATTHMLGNILITLDGDLAGCESQILAWHRIPADDENPVRDLTAQARYVDRIERQAKGSGGSPTVPSCSTGPASNRPARSSRSGPMSSGAATTATTCPTPSSNIAGWP